MPSAFNFARTVGLGISPKSADPAWQCTRQALAALVRSCRQAAITAGGEFRPALRTLCAKQGTPRAPHCRQSINAPLSPGNQAETIHPSKGSKGGNPQHG
jgi:hypothetical protein